MPICSVKDCGKKADVRVILYDVYRDVPDVFFEQDYTCQFLCFSHMAQNEAGAKSHDHLPEDWPRGERFSVAQLLDLPHRDPQPTEMRRARGVTHYPFTNQHQAQGFTIYEPLDR